MWWIIECKPLVLGLGQIAVEFRVCLEWVRRSAGCGAAGEPADAEHLAQLSHLAQHGGARHLAGREGVSNSRLH